MITTPDGPMLASPVLAHSVEPGDLLLPLIGHDADGTAGGCNRVLSVRRIDASEVPNTPADLGPPWTGLTIAIRAQTWIGLEYTGYAPANQPLMRAVGARAARGGAR